MLDRVQGWLKSRPPALSTGIIVFLLGLYLIDSKGSLRESNALNTDALTKLQIGRLSMYPLFHVSLVHLAVNLVGLIPLLAAYEAVHGTVRTGIVLNVTAVLTGLLYCLLAIVLRSSASAVGVSAWVFTLFAYYSWQQYTVKPKTIVFGQPVPTWAAPVLPLIITAIILPGSSFAGHFFGMIVGYIYALGYIDILIEPSTNVVEWIEARIAPLISLLSNIVNWIKEVEARNLRHPQNDVLPTTSTGHVLGSA